MLWLPPLPQHRSSQRYGSAWIISGIVHGLLIAGGLWGGTQILDTPRPTIRLVFVEPPPPPPAPLGAPTAEGVAPVPEQPPAVVEKPKVQERPKPKEPERLTIAKKKKPREEPKPRQPEPPVPPQPEAIPEPAPAVAAAQTGIAAGITAGTDNGVIGGVTGGQAGRCDRRSGERALACQSGGKPSAAGLSRDAGLPTAGSPTRR